MSRLSAASVFSAVIVLSAGCDELNKPIRPLRNPPPRPALSSGATPIVDAGEAGAPAPAISAEPGDVHL